MEFSFNLDSLFVDNIGIFDASLPAKVDRKLSTQLFDVIDQMGVASQKAQSLHSPVTSSDKLLSSDHILYVLKQTDSEKFTILGILKVGRKRLFLLDEVNKQHEIIPLCILDFYIHEDYQRHGFGIKLFEFMIRHQCVDVIDIAIDRPSNRFLSFLEKHYKLQDAIPQNNNFVIFKGFFSRYNDETYEWSNQKNHIANGKNEQNCCITDNSFSLETVKNKRTIFNNSSNISEVVFGKIT